MAQSFNPNDLWEPFGAFSQAVVAGEGQTVHLKGQVALSRDGAIVGPGDMNAQVRQVLTNMRTLLSSMSGRMSDVVSLTHFTTDIEAFMAAGPVRTEFFDAPFPVTTTVEVAALYDPRLLIEISGIAEIPKSRFKAPAAAVSMHR